MTTYCSICLVRPLTVTHEQRRGYCDACAQKREDRKAGDRRIGAGGVAR